MPYICTTCFQLYDITSIKSSTNNTNDNIIAPISMCPKLDCIGSIHHIDELIYPTIKILNMKGYRTKACCSTHIYDTSDIKSSYILFLFKYKFNELPRMNELITLEHVTEIRRNFSKDEYSNDVQLFELILENSKNLINWAMALPAPEPLWVSKSDIV